MTSISIDLSKNIDPVIVDCIKSVKNVADDLGIDFFVVGAAARNLILGQYYGLPTGLQTRDIDLGITVIDWKLYEKMKDRLISTGSFSPDKKIVHRLKYKNEYPVDIIPFGSVEKSGGLISWPLNTPLK
jgi:predicted nucleotidyltransferase